ncbi:MAG: hypothetical protein WCT31_03135, partial [Candidatus Micrarchaeia archaeon]
GETEFRDLTDGHLFGHFPMCMFGLKEELELVAERMTDMARIAGKDLYFEGQVRSKFGSDLFLTQISPHAWPEVKIPDGRQVPLIQNKHSRGNWVIGSGVVFCQGDYNAISVRGELDDFIVGMAGRLATTVSYPDTPVELKPENFYVYEHAAGILDLRSHGEQPFSPHTAGVFRELGIPVINVENAEAVRGKVNFYLWANELTQKAGVVFVD